MFILPQDTKDRRRPAPSTPKPSTPKPTRPQSISKKNKKGETVVKTKTAEGRKKLVLKDKKQVSTVKKGKKTLSREVNHRNADGSHKKTVTKKADGSKSVRKYKQGKTFMDNKTITKSTDKDGNKSRKVYNFGKRNKKGETTSTTRTKDSKGRVTTKRDIYTKNKKGEAIVKTKTKGPDGKKTISRRKDPPMNSFGRTGGTFATSKTGPRPSQPKPTKKSTSPTVGEKRKLAAESGKPRNINVQPTDRHAYSKYLGSLI